MREIPPLRTLVLRAVGPPTCDPELTFGGVASAAAATKSGTNKSGKRSREESDEHAKTSSDYVTTNEGGSTKRRRSEETMTLSSRLLRSLRRRPVEGSEVGDPPRTTLESIPLARRPYAGLARPNANDVDLSHPWILVQDPPRRGGGIDDSSGIEKMMVVENGNPAVDCLQMFIDALVESGRTGDSRLGVNFFREWVTAVAGEGGGDDDGGSTKVSSKKRKKKRDRKSRDRDSGGDASSVLRLGTLSLHNLSLASTKTFRSMEKAGVGRHLSVLDISGVHGLTDIILSTTLCSGSFPRIRRLSLKNCRKITGKGVSSLVKLPDLRALDLGGCFNVLPTDVVALAEHHPGTERGTFDEIYASGLGWSDLTLESLLDFAHPHLRGLGVGFAKHLSGSGLVLALSRAGGTLERLAVPFCDSPDDAAMAALGKALPKLACIDLRGCQKVSSLTGMMDGRVSAGVYKGISPGEDDGDNTKVAGKSAGEVRDGGTDGHLFVLARYSGITKNSLEDTLKNHQHGIGECLTCVLDGGGIGEGIRR